MVITPFNLVAKKEYLLLSILFNIKDALHNSKARMDRDIVIEINASISR